MIDNWNACFSHILDVEGGFFDHPRDPGGATNMGITKKTYERWLGRACTVDELKQIPVPIVEQIYRDFYWSKVRGDILPDGVDLILFDLGVHAGYPRSIRMAQRVVGTKPDGILGPITLAAIREKDLLDFINQFSERKMAFYRRLSTWDVFGRGFTNRSKKTQIAALNLIRE